MSKADEKENLIKWLKQVPIFENLEDKQLKKLQSAFTTKKFKEGEVIAKEGEMSVAFYLVSDGEVEVRKGKKTIANLGRGQFFCDTTFLYQYLCSAHVRGKTNTTSRGLPSCQFETRMLTRRKVPL